MKYFIFLIYLFLSFSNYAFSEFKCPNGTTLKEKKSESNTYLEYCMKDNKKEGPYLETIKGRKFEFRTYQNGQRHGVSHYFKDDGSPANENYYLKGNFVSKQQFFRENPNNENAAQIGELTKKCSGANGKACFDLWKVLGNSGETIKYLKKACKLGYQEGCFEHGKSLKKIVEYRKEGEQLIINACNKGFQPACKKFNEIQECKAIQLKVSYCHHIVLLMRQKIQIKNEMTHSQQSGIKPNEIKLKQIEINQYKTKQIRDNVEKRLSKEFRINSSDIDCMIDYVNIGYNVKTPEWLNKELHAKYNECETK